MLTLPGAKVALADISTPLGGLSITGSDAEQVAIIITAAFGKLYAGTFPGAIVSGGGTSSLWIAGSPADVNAKLATLVYAAPSAGADTLSISVVDTSGQTPGPAILPVRVVPLITPPNLPDPTLTISGGTLTLDTRHLDGLTLNVHDQATGAGAATLILGDTTLGTNTTLDIASSDPASPAPRVAITRRVEWDGATNFHTGPALVTLAQNAVLTNAGRISFANSSAQLTGAGTLQNDGIIAVAPTAAPAIDVAVTGSGVISLAAGARLTLGAPVAASETVRFEANSGFLELDAPQSMQATIAGFAAGDRIQLGAIQTDAADYTPTAAGGTLTLFNGAQVAARLNFAGAHLLSDFRLDVATGAAVDGGAITALSVLTPAAPLAGSAAAAGSDVYRFFDSTSGTQFLTQDAAERDSVIATRPDLKLEGVAMRAVASTADDPAATAVYRFFDTVHGTHFFTADAAEKDALLASRPDLVFEPSSTILEHATQQAGDLPVFRFFDTATGTHFYTASATERANVLTTRPDLTAEGVAFYTPSA